MLVKTYGSAIYGVSAITITLEVSVEKGINFLIVGLPDSAVRESQQRVMSAILQSGYAAPQRRIIVNMAPAEVKEYKKVV